MNVYVQLPEEDKDMEHTLIRPIFIILLFGLLNSSAHADRTPVQSDVQVVRALDNLERIAVLEGDINTLKKLWSEDFIVNNPQNSISSNRDAVIHFVKNGHIKYALFDRDIEQIRLFDDIAIVMGSETVVPRNDPTASPTQRRFTNVWQKNGDTWQMIARHANTVATSSGKQN